MEMITLRTKKERTVEIDLEASTKEIEEIRANAKIEVTTEAEIEATAATEVVIDEEAEEASSTNPQEKKSIISQTSECGT